ncbi:MAG: asparagine synthase-related protein, partial [Actinomycetota bacterium]|nr:asparagine synthase-related protein [Actinomycetota bacterium]
SIIAAIMKNHKDGIHTYSVGFNKSADIIYSRKVAEYIGSNHHEYNLDINEIFKVIPEVIYTLESFDAPLVRSSIGNLAVSKISSESDIIFSGEGGDEVFAGYNYFLDLNSSDSVQNELYNAINSLHNTALQRVDRFANKYSIDLRLPLLDEQLIDYSLGVPAELKINKKKKATKNILRKVAEKYLPADIVWRTKDKFWEGAGIYDKLQNKVEDIITDKEFEDNSLLKNGFKLRNKEEYYYYKIFNNFFPDIDYSRFLSFTKDFN